MLNSNSYELLKELLLRRIRIYSEHVEKNGDNKSLRAFYEGQYLAHESIHEFVEYLKLTQKTEEV